MRAAVRTLPTRINLQSITVIAPYYGIRFSIVSQPHSKALRTSALFGPPAREFSQVDLKNSYCSRAGHRSNSIDITRKVEERKPSDGDSTIFALSTPPGKSAIAVVRVSGPACLDVCTL